MYPGGVRSLVQGWTKNIATGAASVPWWAGLLVAGWIWSLAGGPFTSAWFYVASVAQLLVQGRRVGRFGVVSAVLYPLLLVFFLAVFLRSVVLTALRRPVRWRDRLVPVRSRR
jgi:4,4'-diaponeurosporenoate glycosyltransferase